LIKKLKEYRKDWFSTNQIYTISKSRVCYL
jgi:hypothetical protein